MALKMTEEQIERQQIEEVFLLGGGELESEPLVFIEPSDTSDVRSNEDVIDVHTRHYWYEGVPEYEETYGSNRNETFWNEYMTIVSCGMFGGEPERIVTSDGRTWRRVASYTTSGERECPFRTWDPVEHEDHQGDGTRVVTVEEADEEHEWCPLCEAEIGDEHGYIYLGDGWAETIFERMQQHQVVVGNIGTVYSGEDRVEAKRKFEEYVRQSEQDEGRAGREGVTWLVDDEIEDEHEGDMGDDTDNESEEV